MKLKLFIPILLIALSLACGGSNDPPSTPRPEAPPFSEIRTNYKTMTDAQFDNYADDVIGSVARSWEGRVSEVQENDDTPGGYVIMIDMSDEPGPEVLLGVGESTALRFTKLEKITFSGTIDDVDNSIGLTIIILSGNTR